MTKEGHRAPSGTPRRFVVPGLLALLASGVLLAVLLTRDDNAVVETARTSTPASAGITTTSTTRDPRAEVVDRLRVILRVRDRAFHDRNAGLLESVYTTDCPCLEGDRNSIQELQSKNLRLVGGATSIRVQRVERVSSRLWLVIADFKSDPLRIEAEGNRVIRQEPAGSDLFQFALAKPRDSSEWLLGRATAYQDG
jgi:hypothetical protein